MHIILLGASGQIGSPTLLELARAFPNAMITGTSRSGVPPQSYLGSTIRFQAFDPFQDDWRKLGKADIVINCIGQIREEKGCSFEQIHVGLTRNILAHRDLLGQPRVIQVSALGAGQHPEVAFLATKAKADTLLLDAGNSHIIRPSIVCTNDTMLVRKFRQLLRISTRTGGRLFLPAGFTGALIQPIALQDLVEMIVAVAVNGFPESVISAVGPAPISFGSLIDLMTKVNQASIRLHFFPPRLISGFVKYLADPFFPALINYDQFRLLFSDNVGSVKQTQQLLSRMPDDTLPFWRTQLRVRSSHQISDAIKSV